MEMSDKYWIARFIRAYITAYHGTTKEAYDWVTTKITNFINIAPDELFTLEDKGIGALKACIDYINSYDSDARDERALSDKVDEHKSFFTLHIDKCRVQNIYRELNGTD